MTNGTLFAQNSGFAIPLPLSPTRSLANRAVLREVQNATHFPHFPNFPSQPPWEIREIRATPTSTAACVLPSRPPAMQKIKIGKRLSTPLPSTRFEGPPSQAR